MTGNESLLAVLRSFDKADIPYMVVGSYSSNFYGIPRMTKGADLVVHLPASRWAELASILPDGISLEEQSGFEMVTGTHRERLRVRESRFEIELFKLSPDAHDQERFARRRRQQIFQEADVFLPTAEDIVVQKLRWSKSARRGKDFDDAVAVLSVQGKHAFDWPYMEKWCAEHDSLGTLEAAKAEAAAIWEADEAG